MEKLPIDRRVRQMESEGVIFRPGFEVGVTVSVQRLLDDYDVLVMADGAEAGRNLEVPGRELDGVHYAMEFLTQQNKRNAGDPEVHRRAQGGAFCRQPACMWWRSRRQRHRVRLRRHLQPPGHGLGDSGLRSCRSRRGRKTSS